MSPYQHIRQWLRLALSLRRKFPGKGFVQFARLGFGLIFLSFGVWFPGLREAIFAALVERIGSVPAGDDISVVSARVQLWASLTAFGIGTAVILVSLIGYLRFMMRTRPGSENEGSISVNVQPHTRFETLIRTVAEHGGYTVDLGGIPQDVLDLRVLDGPILANDFEDFLEKTLLRIPPSDPLRLQVDDGVYRLTTQPSDK